MTGFDSKRQAAQDKMELADAYASAVAATPNMPTPLERKLAVERIERARNALEAALEQQAEPPPEWPLIKNILDEYGLDAIAFVAAWKAAQQQAEPVNQVSCFCHDGVSLQMVSGGAAPEGYLGKVTLLIDGEYVDYVKVQPSRWRICARTQLVTSISDGRSHQAHTSRLPSTLPHPSASG